MPVRVEKGEGVLENAKEYWRKPGRIEDGQEVLKMPGTIGDSQGWYVRAK